MEGVASEAASLAGQLGKLIYLYDDNQGKRRARAVENSLDKRRSTGKHIVPLPEGIKARQV
ncbi:hypothetical protein PTKU46_79840 [Paraburkholderia terrae]